MHHTRPWITAGVALVGAGLLAATPGAASMSGPLPTLGTPDIQLTATDMVLEFVRHGLSTDNVQLINGSVAPGAHLADYPDPYNGFHQAEAVGQALFDEYGTDGVDGIFASGLVRTQETAAPFAGLMGMDVTNLSGLNEINAGIWEGIQSSTVDQFKAVALSYLMAPMLWTYGLYSVPLLGSSDFNGMAFNDRFGDAVQTIYDHSLSLDDPTMHDVAFSHGGAIMVWTLMNVKNPDFDLLLEHPLTNTSRVVIEGNPTDGWTLVNWDGVEVSATPDSMTGLIVDVRDLIVAPQMASYHIQQALLSMDPDQITSAIQTGFQDVFNAVTQFPQAVFETLSGAFGDATSGGVEATNDAIGDVVASLAS
ncbi:histidine phosphatase family protein [Mycolicibacter terrae]|uniref:Histidine phosphatase family protein n=1 Tax=Mycolicibacter terrae TaxID=1788 RepID=A0ACD2EMX7_9MYCO|nr:histidine phosphatase family protein [Mycolicibacter terrae]RRR44716.1 histidine phosphatase family protein [Mycolicibacter terrae]